MHTSARKTTLKWRKVKGSILRPEPKQKTGFFVAYKDGLIKYSRKPILERTSYNDYGTLVRDGKFHIPQSDRAVVDTRMLIQ